MKRKKRYANVSIITNQLSPSDDERQLKNDNFFTPKDNGKYPKTSLNTCLSSYINVWVPVLHIKKQILCSYEVKYTTAFSFSKTSLQVRQINQRIEKQII